MNYEQLSDLINANIIPGVPKGITAAKLKEILSELLDFTNLTQGDYQGTAAPTTNPGTPTTPVYYFATTTGTYTNFGGLAVTAGDGVNILSFIPGSGWSKAVVPVDLATYATKSELDAKTSNQELRVESLNLVNQQDPDFGVGTLSSSTGLPSSNSSYYRSGFIELGSNTQITTYSARWVWFYNSSKNYIGSTFLQVATNDSSKVYTLVNVPVGAFYIRAVSSNTQNEMMVVFGNNIIPYQPFGFLQIKEEFAPMIGEEKIKNNSVTPEKTTFFSTGLNLVNTEDPEYLPNKALTSSTGLPSGSISSDVSTGFIDISELDVFTIFSGRYLWFYNEFKIYISGSFQILTTSTSLKVYSIINSKPSGAVYIRVTSTLVQSTDLMVYSGSEEKPFEPYRFGINQDFLPQTINENSVKNIVFGSVQQEQIVWYGDSWSNRLASYTWIDKICQALGAIPYKQGIGSTTIINSGTIAYIDSNGRFVARPPDAQPGGTTQIASSMCMLERIQAMIPSDSKAIVVMGGINDFISNSTIGNDGDSVDTTVWGATRLMFQRIQTQAPLAKVVCILPPYVYRVDRTETQRRNIKNAIRTICDQMSIRCIDATGINAFNYTNYLPDDVHPNDAGSEVIASELLPNLQYLLL